MMETILRKLVMLMVALYENFYFFKIMFDLSFKKVAGK